MGERKRRLITAIVEGEDRAVITRFFGISEKELDSFVERNKKQITFMMLKQTSKKSKSWNKHTVGSNVNVDRDDSGTNITIW
jgi:hypothetical protein